MTNGTNFEPAETLFTSPVDASLAAEDLNWWDGYVSRLTDLSPTAHEVLEADCRYVVDRGIFGVGEPGDARWPPSRVRRGLVMGSVQSGKTASMFGVAARSLDRKVDLVVVLAGTRLSLWRQTFGRLEAQLENDASGAAREQRRVLVPKPGEVAGPEGRVPLSTLYSIEPARVRRAIRDGRPIVVVAMKHADHLRALGQVLRQAVFPAVEGSDRPFHMLVLDDEADDGSILDAVVEEGEDPVYGNLKQIPRAIADLWRPRSDGEAPANLFASYIAYTATPQANFLQQDHNPLAPKDFVVSLRTAYDRGGMEPRETSYFEPKGIKAYYTGGEVFYRRAATAELCLPTTDDAALDRNDAVRGFLVAGAIRKLREPDALGPLSARGVTFDSREELVRLAPSPHSMLIHPSAAINDHLSTALDLLEWSGHLDRSAAQRELSLGAAYLSQELTSNIDVEPEAWRVWLERYRGSAEQLRLEFSLPQAADMPEWADIEELLRSEIIPGTRVSVVNSDPNSDDRPQYDPELRDDGWHAPPDLSTIFVSGNVMSRGLTLEGLTTTLFLRQSEQPLADSQMQMQRWLGYRGSYLELCRVFAPQLQLDLFAAYHEGDEALRQAVVFAMNQNETSAPEPIALQGKIFLATGKIANLSTQPLCPGARPFVHLVNDGERVDPNARVLGSLFGSLASADVIAGGALRGRMLSEPLSLDESADLVGSLSFEGYAPGSGSWQAEMWRQVQARVETQGPLLGSGPLYRPLEPRGGAAPSPVRSDCPYAMSAYFRLWAASLTRHVRGLFPTESELVRWPMLDLSVKARQQPKFWVGIRYGGGRIVKDEPLADLPFEIQATERSLEHGELPVFWGSRAPQAGPDGYRGDEFLDYYFRGQEPPARVDGVPEWRPVGDDGLILFYVNQLPGQPHPSVAMGVCIPLGGPDQFSATSATVRVAA